MIFLCNICFAEINVTQEGIITTGPIPKPNSIEDIKGFVKISNDTQPHIFPAITGSIGVIGAISTGIAVGASTPVIVITTLSSGIVYYIYGYGVEKALDQWIMGQYVKDGLSPSEKAYYRKLVAADEMSKLEAVFGHMTENDRYALGKELMNSATVAGFKEEPGMFQDFNYRLIYAKESMRTKLIDIKDKSIAISNSTQNEIKNINYKMIDIRDSIHSKFF
jgi:hypothetical protein